MKEQQRHLQEILASAVKEHGIAEVWAAIDAWLPTIAPELAAHLGRVSEHRLRVRRLSLAAQRIANVVAPRPRKRRGKGV